MNKKERENNGGYITKKRYTFFNLSKYNENYITKIF
jgi:hypothetical protein